LRARRELHKFRLALQPRLLSGSVSGRLEPDVICKHEQLSISFQFNGDTALGSLETYFPIRIPLTRNL
jgi:hypothetical protein